MYNRESSRTVPFAYRGNHHEKSHDGWAQMAVLVVKKTHTLLVMISVFMRNINTMTMAKAENTLAIIRMLEVYQQFKKHK